ncbi:MAG: toll/interleukin-1 receptor domain-containing protein [Candidatus Tenebribacter davisii]|nr:toll/interleukin-1 receptor domain-containing protein [Candidatus Tenebribacter davisii]
MERNNIPEFEKQLDKKLHLMNIYYSTQKKYNYQKIIVKSDITVKTTPSENINDYTTYLIVEFILDSEIIAELIQDRRSFEENLKNDINEQCFSNIDDELVSKIAIELKSNDSTDWRFESGLLNNTELTDENKINEIWGDEKRYKIFLSHKASFKGQASNLKKHLEDYGLSCFVAHEDATPTKKWIVKIEEALRSMNLLIALITDDFNDSEWTHQEIGFALGRGIKVYAVKLESITSKGFQNQFQDIIANWGNAEIKLIETMKNVNPEWTDIITNALKYSKSFIQSGKLLPYIDELLNVNSQQLNNIIEAFNNNNQISNCNKFVVNICSILKRISGEEFIIVKKDSEKKLERVVEEMERNDNEDIPF